MLAAARLRSLAMSDAPATAPSPTPPAAAAPPAPPPVYPVGPSPHLKDTAHTTRRMMVDVLLALAAPFAMALVVFRWYAVWQVAVCAVAALLAEAAFTRLRGRPVARALRDGSALVTGVILGLSLPWSAPWYVGVIGAVVAIGIGKVAFGGLGQNIFNPAMVGRAFVMISFPAALGAGAYQVSAAALDAVTQATPLTAAKQLGQDTAIAALLVGNHNGSLGEVSVLACLLGGLYLCVRRTASWEIPVGLLVAVYVLGGLGEVLAGVRSPLPMLRLTGLQHLLSGAVIFGAFFIATDPVTSPLTPRGKFAFGAGLGALVMVIRVFSGYPEGVMFAVLIMNGLTPILNQWTIPTPLGGPTPPPAPKPPTPVPAPAATPAPPVPPATTKPGA